jgi:hypothetical protein
VPSAKLPLLTTVGEAERPVAIAAARQLSAAVGTALGADWPVALFLSDPEGETGSGSIWIASLIGDVGRDEAIETTTRRWQERIERWSHRGNPRILLSTLFRSVASSDDRRATVERLRRLNMMALSLSRSTGVEIVDIDRLFAWYGRDTLGTDYRCVGERAALLGGHAIAAAIFAGGLDEVLPGPVQEAAARHHGGIDDVATILDRRIAAR